MQVTVNPRIWQPGIYLPGYVLQAQGRSGRIASTITFQEQRRIFGSLYV